MKDSLIYHLREKTKGARDFLGFPKKKKSEQILELQRENFVNQIIIPLIKTIAEKEASQGRDSVKIIRIDKISSFDGEVGYENNTPVGIGKKIFQWCKKEKLNPEVRPEYSGGNKIQITGYYLYISWKK